MPINFMPEEIMETMHMVQVDNLDIRTITMGISLRDCCDPEIKTVAQKFTIKLRKKRRS